MHDKCYACPYRLNRFCRKYEVEIPLTQLIPMECEIKLYRCFLCELRPCFYYLKDYKAHIKRYHSLKI